MTVRPYSDGKRYKRWKGSGFLKRYSAAGLTALMMLTACSATTDTGTAVTEPVSTTETIAAEPETAAETTQTTVSSVQVTDESEEQTTASTASAVTSEPVEYDYEHGDDGYFCLLENGLEFELARQLSGTCWICAASCCMSTSYQMDTDEVVAFDQKELVERIYSDDKDEGVFLKEGTDKEMFGGFAQVAVNELSLGFDDGFVLDDYINAQDWSDDEIKEGIKKYGALYIAVPDTDRKKMRYFGRYFTINFPDAKDDDFDHAISIIGWDDNFPREYFAVPASRDGAWITYNSNFPKDYYYVSYDTPIDRLYDPPAFLSVTRKYTKVLSHDGGQGLTPPVTTGDVTTAANVFSGEGTLSAVGTFTAADDEDITIKLLTPDLSECLYTQECRIDHKGYHVIELDQPLEVNEYALSVSYKSGAPIEGKYEQDEYGLLYCAPKSESGQSFILIDDRWYDMSEKTTWDMCGAETNNACIRALYT